MNKNIVLIGFMGSGKSTIGRLLSRRLNLECVSIDDLIETREGMTISSLFKDKGEEHFRILEHQAVKELSARQGLIIDCGGGIVLNNENLKLLKQNGIVFHLKASPEVIYSRIRHESKRPLINVPDPLGRIKELYIQRLPLYNQADHTVDADMTVERQVDEILRKI